MMDSPPAPQPLVNFTECTRIPGIWNHESNDFDPCFFKICLQLPIFSLLTICSSYYLGKRRVCHAIYTTWNSFQSGIIYFRSIVISLLILNPLLSFILLFGIEKDPIGFIEMIIETVKIFAWVLHLAYTLRLKRGLSYNTRGPKSIILIWLLTGTISLLNFRSLYFNSITTNQHHSDSESSHLMIVLKTNKKVLQLWLSGTEAFFQWLYLLTLIPGSVHLEERQYRSILIDQPAEPHSILDHETNSYVGFHEDDGDPLYLGIAKENVGWISKFVFGWVNPLMNKGSCGYIRYSDDLFDLPTKISTVYVATNFQKWTTNSRSSLIRSLHACFCFEFYSLGFLKLLSDASGFAGPILLNLLVKFIENKDGQSENISCGYLYVFGMFASTLVGALANVHFNMNMAELNLKIRAAIVTSIYRKTVLMSRSTMDKFSTGEIINYMSTDTERIQNFCPSFHAFWSLPVQIGVALYLLYCQIGVAFLAGVGFSILLIPINKLIANKIGELSTKMMDFKDKRVKLMSEILYGIRTLKLHTWEVFFAQRVMGVRKHELSALKGRKYLDALCVYFWATTPVLVSVLSFGTYVLLGNELTAAKVFTSLALFNMLISPLNALPWVINGVVESWVSIKRVSKLLQAEETEPYDVYLPMSPFLRNTHDIIVENGNFAWSVDATNLQIEGLSLEIKKGQLVGIVGEVGQGKSSLLMSLLGELTKTSGIVSLSDPNKGFGVVLQEPWIQRGSIRKNILFSKTYNSTLYNNVIDACNLDQDLSEFENGDDTYVSDNGSSLSGGQKMRLTLARAVYQDKSIYLMDDIFSAVDFKVAKHLYKHCLMGMLKDKTRIICTHHVKFLRYADLILVMDNGKIINRGTPTEILPIFFDEDMSDDASAVWKKDTLGLLPKSPSSISLETTDQSLVSPDYDRMARSADFINKPENPFNEEHQQEGAIALDVYKAYWKAVGPSLSILVLVSLFFMQATKNLSDLWLAHWVSHGSNSSATGNITTPSPIPPLYIEDVTSLYEPELDTDTSFTPSEELLFSNSSHGESQDLYSNGSFFIQFANSYLFLSNYDPSLKYYFTVFILIGLCNTIFTLSRAFLFAYGSIQGGTRTHVRLLKIILKAKMSFFDKTPIGRVLNRFSSDVSTIDDSLPFIMNILLAQLYGLLGTLIVTCFALPMVLFIIIPLLLVVNNIQKYYRLTARQLRRLSSVSLSPMYAHFSETLKGLITIRGMRATRRFEDENEVYLEANQKAVYSTQAVSQWLNFRLQIVGVLVITGVGLLGVIQHKMGTANAGIIGLAISYALTVTNSLSGFVTYFTETEKEMVAVERVYEYIKDTETETRSRNAVNLPYTWPLQGVISFQNVSLRYRPNLPYAIRNINFETRPCEKIGVFGRTGSGKSSLLQALFRMVEFEGNILIDTVNIKQLNLKELRSHMWIIPQDPLIFTGTLRENIDPKGEFNEDNIRRAIQKCQLSSLLRRLGSLDADVGENLSAGEKQIIQLVRALLVNPKILCIDEATANVDQDTDKIIQATIRTSFRTSTVITIAHRVTNILHSDRVIVMKNNCIIEFDGPEKLMLDKSSHFYQLAQGNL